MMKIIKHPLLLFIIKLDSRYSLPGLHTLHSMLLTFFFFEGGKIADEKDNTRVWIEREKAQNTKNCDVEIYSSGNLVVVYYMRAL